ncbi:MAG TPA: 3'-5' exonuclease [Polaromonas sp.]|uniref:3'-5' exonuclease n=1 Tax=Polaromonas sp. TaxID=1869339 RepID=UPI002D2D79D7|nr:3'-5' exonuclease [Polaromonas sp.]HYW55341.1 3'-5' exonuclease [Polaromonas sp.]
MPHIPSPTKEELAALEPLNRLGLGDIVLVATREQASLAFKALAACAAVGFDTESKPTFFKDQVSEGPHIVQFATLTKAYVFQLHDEGCREVVCTLLASDSIAKVGFGLAGDHQQIRRTLGVEPSNVLDLNVIFKKQGYAKELGVRGAVAVLFNRRFLKSRKATTSNWANRQLTESQIVYAANDAWAAIKVFDALGLPAVKAIKP